MPLAEEERSAASYDLHKRLFAYFDNLLDHATEVRWLAEASVARSVCAELHRVGELKAVSQCFCIMPNHVHLLVQLPDEEGFSFVRMMQLLKGRSAYVANRILGRRGGFWQQESYDHLVRAGQEWTRIKDYILNKPVKAGLVASWEKWPFTYLKEGL